MSDTNWRGMLLGIVALILISVVAVQTPESREAALTGDSNSTEDLEGSNSLEVAEPGGQGSADEAEAGDSGGTGSQSGGRQLECRGGRNGGGTDTGVSATEIRLASTHVLTGIGSSFLGLSHFGMEAVVARVNGEGGICGRRLTLDLRDDAWDAARGRQFLEDFINQGYFALPVVPSSEGLTAAINARVIGRAGIPVVGSDGMLKEQYQESWVWPVALATVSQMRIMAKHAYDKGARTFGIVYDNRYKFGLEGASAFRTYVNSLGGARLKAFVGIAPLQSSYNSEANAFNEACGSSDCDFVAFLLEPATASTWVKSQPVVEGEKKGFGRILTGGAQPLFNERFARDCGDACNGMLVWTGYNPPVGPLKNLPGVAEYVRDIQSLEPGADVRNQFLQGSYLGMRVFVEALRKVGPDLTRARTGQVMNSMAYQSDLAPSLRWTSQNRFANLAGQAFEMLYASGDFADFRSAGTGFLKDPTPGVIP